MDVLAMAHVEQTLVPPLHGAHHGLGIPGHGLSELVICGTLAHEG